MLFICPGPPQESAAGDTLQDVQMQLLRLTSLEPRHETLDPCHEPTTQTNQSPQENAAGDTLEEALADAQLQRDCQARLAAVVAMLRADHLQARHHPPAHCATRLSFLPKHPYSTSTARPPPYRTFPGALSDLLIESASSAFE